MLERTKNHGISDGPHNGWLEPAKDPKNHREAKKGEVYLLSMMSLMCHIGPNCVHLLHGLHTQVKARVLMIQTIQEFGGKRIFMQSLETNVGFYLFQWEFNDSVEVVEHPKQTSPMAMLGRI